MQIKIEHALEAGDTLWSVLLGGTFAPIAAGLIGTFGIWLIASCIYMDPWQYVAKPCHRRGAMLTGPCTRLQFAQQLRTVPLHHHLFHERAERLQLLQCESWSAKSEERYMS